MRVPRICLRVAQENARAPEGVQVPESLSIIDCRECFVSSIIRERVASVN